MIRYCERCGRGNIRDYEYGQASRPLPAGECSHCAGKPVDEASELLVTPAELAEIIGAGQEHFTRTTADGHFVEGGPIPGTQTIPSEYDATLDPAVLVDELPEKVGDVLDWVDAAPTVEQRAARVRTARLAEEERPNPRKTILTLT